MRSDAHPLAYPEVSPDILDVPATFGPSFDDPKFMPTFFIGVGGLGAGILSTIKRRLFDLVGEKADSVTAWLAIDTDKETLKTLSLREDASALATRDTLHIPLRRPKQYRDASQNMLRWVSRRWLYNIPRSLKTRGFRPLGRIALVDHADQIIQQLRSRLDQFRQDEEPNQKIRIVLLAGMGGGTGGGTIIDIAQAVRSVAAETSIEVEVHGLFGVTYRPEGNTDSLAAANMHSLMTELNHSQHFGNAGSAPPPAPADQFESSQRPFDEVYCVSISGSNAERSACLDSIADYAALETAGISRHICASCRNEDDATRVETMKEWTLRTFACIAPDRIAQRSAALVATQVRQQTLDYWLSQADFPQQDETISAAFGSMRNTVFAQAILAEFPQVTVPADTPDGNSPAAPHNRRRRTSIKQAAAALISQAEQMMDSHNTANGHANGQPLSAPVASLGKQIVADYCQSLRGADEKAPFAEEVLAEMMSYHIGEYLASNATSGEEIARTAVQFADLGVLNCGFRRRAFVLTPTGGDDSQRWSALKDLRPTVQSIAAAVPETFLVCEGNGLLPVHLASRIAEVFPEIDEAAGRLHARSDIEWSDLREQLESS